MSGYMHIMYIQCHASIKTHILYIILVTTVQRKRGEMAEERQTDLEIWGGGGELERKRREVLSCLESIVLGDSVDGIGGTL